MTRQEQLQLCKVCVNRKMDFQKGMICSLTGEKANFEDHCPDFKKDEGATNSTIGTYVDDELEAGLKILSFCIPLAGAIIYLVNAKKHPKKANQACVAALVGLGFGIVVRVLLMVATH